MVGIPVASTTGLTYTQVRTAMRHIGSLAYAFPPTKQGTGFYRHSLAANIKALKKETLCKPNPTGKKKSYHQLLQGFLQSENLTSKQSIDELAEALLFTNIFERCGMYQS